MQTVRGCHGERLSEDTMGRDCQRVPLGETVRGYHEETLLGS